MASSWERAAVQGANIKAKRAAAIGLRDVQKDLSKQVAEVVKKLNTLPKEVRSKATKKAIRPAANLIRDAAKGNSPVGDTNDGVSLKDSIKTFSLRKSKLALFVAPKMPKKVRTADNKERAKSGHPYYAHWVEFGTRKMKGRAYMRRAYDAKKNAAIELIKKGVETVLSNWEKKNKI